MPTLDLHCPACGHKNVYKLAEMNAVDGAADCHLCGGRVPLSASIGALVVDFQHKHTGRRLRKAVASLPAWLRERSFLASLSEDGAVYQERDPEAELRHLKSRFKAISRGHDQIVLFRRVRWWVAGAVVVGAGLGATLASIPPASLKTMLMDLAAAPSCRAATAVGLAPAKRGAPGVLAVARRG